MFCGMLAGAWLMACNPGSRPGRRNSAAAGRVDRSRGLSQARRGEQEATRRDQVSGPVRAEGFLQGRRRGRRLLILAVTCQVITSSVFLGHALSRCTPNPGRFITPGSRHFLLYSWRRLLALRLHNQASNTYTGRTSDVC